MYYQLSYIIPSSVADLSTLEKIIISVNKKITDNSGVITKPLADLEEQPTQDAGKNGEELEKIKEAQNVRISKNRLSYHIGNVSYGYFLTVIYELPDKNQSGMVKKITDDVKLTKEITRAMNTKYNYAVFAEQAAQKEKSKTIRIPAEKSEQKAPETSAKPARAHKEKVKEETVAEEKPKKSKKTNIDELDEKLEQILSA